MMYESPPIPLLALRTVTYRTKNEWTPSSAGEITADHARSHALGLEDRFIQQRPFSRFPYLSRLIRFFCVNLNLFFYALNLQTDDYTSA